jgi:hypothetical protein
VPLSAELKMIQQLQKLVAKQTKEWDGKVPADRRAEAEARDGAQALSRKQGRVEDLTRKLADQLNKNEEARGAGETR